ETFEDSWKSALHEVPVLENIGNTRRNPQVVFKNVDLPVTVPHQIRSRDMAPDSQGRIDTPALRTIKCGRSDDLFGNNPVLEDLLLVVDVVDELVEDVNALLQPAFNPVPFLSGHDAG